MTPVCPNCQAEILAEGVNIAEGVAHCAKCNQMFTLGAEIEIDETEIPIVERPAGTDVHCLRGPEAIDITIPPMGFRRNHLMWIFLAVFTNGIFGSIFVNNLLRGHYSVLLLLPILALTLIPPACLLYWWFGTTVVRIDRRSATLERKLFGRRWIRTRPLTFLAAAGVRVAYVEQNRTVTTASLVFRRQPAAHPAMTLSDFDRNYVVAGRGWGFALEREPAVQKWLVCEMRRFLREIGHPAWKKD